MFISIHNSTLAHVNIHTRIYSHVIIFDSFIYLQIFCIHMLGNGSQLVWKAVGNG